MNISGKQKILKYLPYAFGEIVLITIGLLLALNINNWNQSRKEFDEGTQYLIELKGELNRNLNRLEYLKRGGYTETAYQVSQKIDSNILELYNSKTTADERIALFFESRVTEVFMVLRRSVYDEGLSNGLISSIETKPTSRKMLWSDESYRRMDSLLYTPTSNDLKVHIHFYYTWLEYRKRVISMKKQLSLSSVNQTNTGLRALFLEGASMLRRQQSSDTLNKDNTSIYNELLINHSWIENTNSKEFKTAITHLENIRIENSTIDSFIDEMTELTMNLISIIDHELDSRN